MHRRRHREGRDRPCRRLADPRRRGLGEPGAAPRRCRCRGECGRDRLCAGGPAAVEEVRQVQEGLPHRPRCDHGDDRPEPPPRAELQAARGGRRPQRGRSRCRGHDGRGQRGPGDPRAARRNRRNHRRADRHRHGGCRICLRQGLRGSGGARDHGHHPDEGGTDPLEGSAPEVPLRRQARPGEVPARQESCGPTRRGSTTAGSSLRRRGTAGRAIWPRSACRRRAPPRRS
jgi:hypothetical protein